MLDIKFIRENPKKVKEACKNKQVDFKIVDRFLEVDKKKRGIIRDLEVLYAKKNKASDLISKTEDQRVRQDIILTMKEVDKQSDALKKELKSVENEFLNLILEFPNIPFDNVPVGKDETENVVVKEIGKKPDFKFQFKDYLELAENLELIDVKRAAKISGPRFGFLKNEAVLLEFALINFGLDILVKEGFIPIIPPVMLKINAARGTGYFQATDEKEAYYLPEDKLYLAGTAEQPLIAMHADEVLDQKVLPLRYVGFSTCFRREAGSYGKDTKGILRVHQFDKLEMISFCQPEKSRKEHKFLLSCQEKLMKQLKLPYRVINICTGDLGRPAAEKYDIETWIPSENKYRETHSTSNCTDFQARRLNIRYKDKTGKLNFVHTLNGTVFAIGRILIAIIENYQKKDGSLRVPKVLQKYIGFKAIR